MGVRRLFVAVYPPPRAAAWLAERLASLSLPPARATATDQLHMTLLFLGETDDLRLPRVIESIQRSASGIAPFQLTVQRLITLPLRGPPRLLAAETSAPPGLVEITRRLVTRLARPSQKQRPKAFLPHITLARFRGSGGPKVEVEVPEPDRPTFPVDHVALMESHLRPDRAEHRLIERVSLEP
ncbi:RNA 2',3'-cyclic phosphodiesterase [Phycisphaerales bacterium]|nr:RNA 2',3'-cyclic phosphodiesterase [Phycisphaerales bacterium]